jgi:hypothetical protein
MNLFVLGFSVGVIATMLFKIGSESGAYTRGLITGRLFAPPPSEEQP